MTGSILSLSLGQVEFGMNAEAQRFLSKSGKALSEAVNAFTFDMNTLVNKTIEDTMINAKKYEAARWVEILLPVSRTVHIQVNIRSKYEH